ncbi:MAG: peptide chain release factor N(5)-glutamine methyltransferase [Dehalococcoidales bacterium]|nr:peptide chain release factor N(5)-glutamine methyltransferase [Dehalococcoidales bacterium]
MTLKQLFCRASNILNSNNIADATLECELLLRHTLKKSRDQIYLDFDYELMPHEKEVFWQLFERRLNGEPIAYITGHREFYGLDFYVNPNVLIPRPESELLVEKTLALSPKYNTPIIADIGTGCGAIAISLALSLPEAKIYATDISAPALLEVALLNCQRYSVTNRICLLQGDMLNPLPEPVDLIVANLPYVKFSELSTINPALFEPILALDGGPDGLDKIRRLCGQAKNKLNPDGHLLLEIGQGQEKAIIPFLHRLFPLAEIEIIPDLSGIDRIITLKLPPNTIHQT